MSATIEFEGKKYQYDQKAVTSYKVLKKVAKAQTNLTEFFEALEIIFEGRDEEYAESLNNDFTKIGELVAAAVNAEGDEAKN